MSFAALSRCLCLAAMMRGIPKHLGMRLALSLQQMRRLAQWVLAKEDPQESFLKSVPASAVSVDIIYPVTPRPPQMLSMTSSKCLAGSCRPSGAILPSILDPELSNPCLQLFVLDPAMLWSF